MSGRFGFRADTGEVFTFEVPSFTTAARVLAVLRAMQLSRQDVVGALDFVPTWQECDYVEGILDELFERLHPLTVISPPGDRELRVNDPEGSTEPEAGEAGGHSRKA